MQSMLYATSPLDAGTFVLLPTSLFVVARAACYIPAWSAARLDPVEAPRVEQSACYLGSEATHRSRLNFDWDPKRKLNRDPVAAAQRSEATLHKAATHTLDDGSPAHRFRNLVQDLSPFLRNTCQPLKGPTQLTLPMTTVANSTQQ
jgi:hypothetical protein